MMLWYQVQRLQERYVSVLDTGRLEEWLELFTEDCLYEIVPRENVDHVPPGGVMRCFGRPRLRDGVAAAALRKVTTRTPGKASLGQLFIRKSPIPAFSAISCVKSLRAISMHAAKQLRRAVFHATNRGSKRGGHIACDTAWAWQLDRAFHRDLLGNRSQVLRRILRTCRENIAYNTLPYNSARMLLLPILRGAHDDNLIGVSDLATHELRYG